MSNKTTSLVEKLIKLRLNLEIMKMSFREQEDEIFSNFEKKFNNIIGSIDKKLKCECNHQYVEDYIDIDPDTSKRITYCSICECTF